MNVERLFGQSEDYGDGPNRTRFIVVMVVCLATMIWALLAISVRRPSDTTLPPKPYTKADLPHLKRNLKALKENASILTGKLSRLDRTSEGRIAAKLWEELFYTPEHYSAFVQNRNVEMAHVLELHPDLTKFINLTKEYQDARYSIATNSDLTDKTAAIAALDKRLQPQFKYPEYSHDRKTFDAARSELFGNAEFDKAREAYRKAWVALALKCHPELGEYFHRVDVYDTAYAYTMSQANALSLDIKTLENAPST
ncbi:hypothetical protein [Pedosphaera parvula]|uniref:Uncharacterized protein n=1 Tax=Pedosphaera parvula (strain Ellin514) TaxID=320771 RepID=B9XT07_PEDPL|nr:hypothetical protein [Pedosphaera parvula]EEF57017.1 hypothetical protein Cflav_PD0052 [Pedosphaera parvula Ellin514]